MKYFKKDFDRPVFENGGMVHDVCHLRGAALSNWVAFPSEFAFSSCSLKSVHPMQTSLQSDSKA
eukprot:623588-Amphidinium_carterae.2